MRLGLFIRFLLATDDKNKYRQHCVYAWVDTWVIALRKGLDVFFYCNVMADSVDLSYEDSNFG
jgi:hypothetical protein